MSPRHILSDVSDGIGTLTLNRPEKLNAYTTEMGEEVTAVLRAWREDAAVRAVEFDLARGRHRAIVTVKARGEVTLVGPFHAGKTEGPCKSFPLAAEDEIRKALGDFLERFLTEAATP